jgi:UDP-N-acetylglucosamine 2-epimerase (non-hydrolysing)
LMIDNLFHSMQNINLKNKDNKKNNFKNYPLPFALLTMHRPSNVDTIEKLQNLLINLKQVSELIPIIFPCHPRTMQALEKYNLLSYFNDYCFILVDPASFDDMVHYYKNALFVITDSGGIQEETTALKIPCLTIRENTERPITVQLGTNTLVGSSKENLLDNVKLILAKRYKRGEVPNFWDGRSAERIWDVIKRNFTDINGLK